ncbi:MAG: RluA family pseudouridine synthase [Chlamydiia bacterium]
MHPIYEDNHYLALVKPSGISTEPHFEEEVKAWIKVRDQKPGNVYLRATHRLDRPASGIVLFAKTEKGLTRMHKLMRERGVKKTYFAFVEGVVKPDRGTWKNYISKGDHRAYLDTIGKEAILNYELIEVRDHNSLLQLDLVTGRYHQIRIQAHVRGHTVLYDEFYKTDRPSKSIALFHSKMEFIHPVKGVSCIIEVNCPFI